MPKAPKRLDVQTVSLIVTFSGVSPARHMVEWSAYLTYLLQWGLGRENVCPLLNYVNGGQRSLLANGVDCHYPLSAFALLHCMHLHVRGLLEKYPTVFLCEHLMDYNLARLHEPTLNLSAHA